MSGHTPGPWIVATSCSWRRILTQIENKPVCVPTTSSHDGHPDLSASEADLRLIASAPMLLEALQAILPFIPIISAKDGGAALYSENVMAADKVREAITAATGETK